MLKKKLGKDQTDTWPKKDLHIVKIIQKLYKNIILLGNYKLKS